MAAIGEAGLDDRFAAAFARLAAVLKPGVTHYYDEFKRPYSPREREPDEYMSVEECVAEMAAFLGK